MRLRFTIPLLSHAAVIMTLALTTPAIAQMVSPNEIRFREARHKEEVEGDLKGAIKLYQSIVAAKADRSLAAKALVHLGRCYEKQGDDDARKTYERVLREFADQNAEAGEARIRLAKMTPGRAEAGVTARKLTKPLGTFAVRTVTRDGKLTAYPYMRRSLIMLVDLTTGKEREVGGGRRLIPPGDSILAVAISPNGSNVAYGHVHADGNCDLRMIGVNATEPRIVQSGLNRFVISDWSHDGSTVLIKEIQPTANSGPLRSLLVNVATGDMKPVYSAGERDSHIFSQQRVVQSRLSPDNRFLAATLHKPAPATGTGVFVIGVDDNQPHGITGAAADAYVFGWSPDGRQLLYVSDQSGSYDLWAAPMKDGRPNGVPIVLQKDIGLVQGSGITDDGSLFYSMTSSFGNLYVGELDIESAAIRNVQPVPQPRGHMSGRATWSPDGRHLLIDRMSEQFASKAIIRDVASGQEHEVKPPEGSFVPEIAPDGRSLTHYETRWAPNGKSIVYLIRREPEAQPKPQRVIVSDLQTGITRSQIDLPSRNGYGMLTVAGDGEHVYVVNGGNASNDSRVVRVDLRTGEEKEICKARPMVWALSPDGSQIACAGFGDTIQILPTQGGPALDLVKGDQFGPMTWTADGKHLIYTTQTSSATGAGGAGVYWIVPATGGNARKIDIGLGSVGMMRVHPDNRHIAISSAGGSTELWVLENIIPSSK